ncbi:MAG: DUF2007 domain-containing protein [Proteobacteria bacterium]|nr:DUF2007 domain-containing protein [Pseudomonadota bacterium]
MRQIFSSPRAENIDRMVALLEEAGIETRVTNRRAYAGHDYKGPSYSARQDSAQWPTVWIVNADDQPRARAILRDAGIAPYTRFAEELAQSRAPKSGRPHWALASKLRIFLIGVILLLIVLRYLGVY